MKYPNQRPRAPTSYMVSWKPGNTRTNVEVEPCACDCFKVILEMVHQLSEIDRFQNEDIYALIKSSLTTSDFKQSLLIRPTAPKDYWEEWTSDNDYTFTPIQIEYCAKDSISVIMWMCKQLMEYDGLSKEEILAVIWSDIERHIVWEDLLNVG